MAQKPAPQAQGLSFTLTKGICLYLKAPFNVLNNSNSIYQSCHNMKIFTNPLSSDLWDSYTK